MNGQEIKERIKRNDELIENLKPTTFVLNKEIQEALEENRRLRSICPHDYGLEGFCIYCGAARELD